MLRCVGPVRPHPSAQTLGSALGTMLKRQVPPLLVVAIPRLPKPRFSSTIVENIIGTNVYTLLGWPHGGLVRAASLRRRPS